MALVLNLEKSKQALTLCLQKAGILRVPEVDLGFDMDVSGSFKDEHEDGLTEVVLGRLVPWGMVFDPDKKLDMFTFSSTHGGRPPAYYVGEVTAENCQGYMRREIIRKVPNWNGGTLYAPVLRMNLEHFGWRPSAQPAQAAPKSSGFFGGFFKKEEPAPASAVPVAQRKSLILFVTDGDTDDERETEALLEEMQRRGEQVYIQFFAINNDKSVRFEFLQHIADRFDNTGLYICRNINEFAQMSDEEINNLIIQEELVKWLLAK